MKKLPSLLFAFKPPTKVQAQKHLDNLSNVTADIAIDVMSSAQKTSAENKKDLAQAFSNDLMFLMWSWPPKAISTKAGRDEIVSRIIEASASLRVAGQDRPPSAWELLTEAGHDLAFPGGLSLMSHMRGCFVFLRQRRGAEAMLSSITDFKLWRQSARIWEAWVKKGRPDLDAGLPPNLVWNEAEGRHVVEPRTLEGSWSKVHPLIVDDIGVEGWDFVTRYIDRAISRAEVMNDTWTARRPRS